MHAAVIVAALIPVALLAWDTAMGGLGANPVEALLHRSGWWALAFLTTTLAVTPLRQLTGIGWLIKLRRTMGLFAFFYATLHFSIYLGLDQLFAFDFILEDIAERPYITVGFTALLLMVPLAVTSTKKMVKRLGGKRWTRLHRLVYVSAVLGVLHFIWLVKADLRQPLIFASLLTTLLGYRLIAPRVKRRLAGRRETEKKVEGARQRPGALPAELRQTS